ncbi:DNA cytosine methyltransferase [Gramella sp. BOM4]|nr:DNA cytosine methyltransferase [Christiangramia bathymodioli]
MKSNATIMKINRSQYNLPLDNAIKNISNGDLTFGEFLAGGGGVTWAAKKTPGIQVRWVLNHDKDAIRTNVFHQEEIQHYWADIYAQDEHELEPVDVVFAGIECKQHSKAKSGKNKVIGSYTMGWELVRYIPWLNPMVIMIENVPEFKKWGPTDENDEPIEGQEGKEFERWKKAIMDMGYEYCESIRNAADDGIQTRRVRYFGIFHRSGIAISFPEFTHSETGTDGKKKWKACGPHLELDNHGTSIFGRKFNEELPKHLRKPMAKNTLRRIAGGIKKFYPEYFQFICNYYGGELTAMRSQSLDAPLNTITTANRHQLITMEKAQFIQDHCHKDHYHKPEDPLNPQLTWQTKQLVTIDNFIAQYYGTDQFQELSKPLNTITTKDRHQLIRIEKFQFLTNYYNSNGNPEHNISKLTDPLPTQLTKEKQQLITLLDGFDIKARFLNREELAACSTFPRKYFSHPELKLSNKTAVKLIGNAVPPEWARLLLSCNVEAIRDYKMNYKTA